MQYGNIAYNAKSERAEEFIHDGEIRATLNMPVSIGMTRR